jgi:hypothetical protein
VISALPKAATQYTYRLVTDDESDVWQLSNLVRLVGPDYGVDWGRGVFPYWLGAFDREGVLWGALLVQPGKPFGRLEYLCLAPSLPHKQKATLTKYLAYSGLNYLHDVGAQVVLTSVETTWPSDWHKVLKRRGATPINECVTYARRVR